MNTNVVNITPTLTVGKNNRLLLLAGPCQIESLDHSIMIAEQLLEITNNMPIDLVFKSSFDKANRTSNNSARGPGLENGLRVLQQVKERTGLPIITDIHQIDQIKAAADVVDILQIPAFLCRQTDIIATAAKTGKCLHIKKGQFLAPQDMKWVVEKAEAAGAKDILLCERGTCHGYHDLIVDMRSLLIMKENGYPVIFDATHSVQSMGGESGKSGGSSHFVAPLSRAATALGVDGLFIECHEDPAKAPSDGASMLPMAKMKELLDSVVKIRSILLS